MLRKVTLDLTDELIGRSRDRVIETESLAFECPIATAIGEATNDKVAKVCVSRRIRLYDEDSEILWQSEPIADNSPARLFILAFGVPYNYKSAPVPAACKLEVELPEEYLK